MGDKVDIAEVDGMIRAIGGAERDLMPILQAIQARYGYLPDVALRRIPVLTRIQPSTIHGVATFYNSFRLRVAGKHRVCVCHGTACHVKGSDRVQESVERALKLTEGRDTDEAGLFTVERVACVGCCTLAPVVVIDSTTYGHQSANSVNAMLKDFLDNSAGKGGERDPLASASAQDGSLPEIRIGVGSCCIANGSVDVIRAVEALLAEQGIRAVVRPVGCVGMCHRTPLVEMVWPGADAKAHRASSTLAMVGRAGVTDAASKIVHVHVKEDSADRIVRHYFAPSSAVHRFKNAVAGWVDRLLDGGAWAPVSNAEVQIESDPSTTAFLGKQVHIATEGCGTLGPLDLDGYLASGGFVGLRKAMAATPDETIVMIKASGLRGRGGAGFPTGQKWALVHAQAEPIRYMVCNGDEGDPGAFMDRMLLESYPYRVLEGMAIAAYCVGAREGYLYIRAEYPLAVRRINEAIRRLEERGLLGDGKWSLTLRVKEGAGAFVCGEETALLASMEGKRGMPRLRPPYPIEKGLWGKPTCVNNVETLACVPWIVRNGVESFSAIGTARSKGTKVFALAGKVKRGGLIEVPMGITVREIVEEIGGGCEDGRTLKAVQVGGPSGGCLPAAACGIPVDYEALTEAGAMMGSGGLVVLDDGDCMVDITRYFLKFTQDQSCGKCTFCRIGTRRMLEVLDRLCSGKAMADDLQRLEVLAHQVKQGSLCGLGQTAPNPVLTTLKYFRAEYEAHMAGRCPAGKCAALIKYVVNEKCIGCTRCAQECPVNAIPAAPYKRHEIDVVKCTRCDACRQVCPVEAIDVV